ncbi:MAG: hydantoinase B/oxoprolinase family protein [Candidatus Caldarchaeum sp.]
MKGIDAFTLEVVKNSLIAVAEEEFIAFGRTSKSPVIYEVLDYAVAITNNKGELVAQANGVPGFLGVLDLAVKDCIAKYGLNGFSDGDIIITNIPYSHGTHLNDVTLISPVLYDGEVVAFSVNKGHWSEVGGMRFGSWTTDSTEIYQEGLQFPLLKLFKAGEPDRDLFELIRTNVRTPDMTLGDMEAQAAALRLGSRRIAQLCEKYGSSTITKAMEAIIKEGEERAYLELLRLPHGTFEAEDYIDDDGLSDNPVYVKARVTVSDDSFTVDYTGSSPQAKGPINSPYSMTVAAAKVMFKAITDPQSPANEGAFRPVKVIAPEGSVFHPKPPAPVATFWEAGSFAAELIWKALAPHVPDKLTAGHFLSVCATIMGGVDDRTGNPFAIVEPQPGGWGAGYNKDGESGMVCSLDGETYIMSNEVIEVRYPIRVEQYSLNLRDKPGAGKFRGGHGIIKDYRVVNSHAIFTASFGRSKFPPWGMSGGGRGTPNYFIIYRRGARPLKTRKAAAVRLQRGDLVRLVTGGGGGYGNPRERDRQLVLEDVRNGYITPREALSTYGVRAKA